MDKKLEADQRLGPKSSGDIESGENKNRLLFRFVQANVGSYLG